MTIIRWETPPPPRRAASERWANIAAELRARPGEWAVVLESEHSGITSATSGIRYGGYTAFTPSGSFEAVSRTLEKTYAIFARYVGDQRQVDDA